MVSRQAEQSQHDPLLRLGPWVRKLLISALVIAGVVVGYFVFQRFLRMAAILLLLAAMFAFLLQPVVEWLVRVSRMKQLHVARTVATLFVYVVLAVALVFLGSATAHGIKRNVQDLQQTWQNSNRNVPDELARLQQWYIAVVPDDIRMQVANNLQRELNDNKDKYLSTITATLFGMARRAGQWVALLIELIFVPLLAFYFLTDASRLREQMLFFVSPRHRSSVLRYSGEMARILRRYVQGQLMLCLIAWAVVTLALLCMGIPGALLLGIIAGVSRAIPLIGPLIGGVPVLAGVLLSPHLAGAFWWVLIGFIALHFFESKFLMPRILGDHLGVHPVIVILSLIIGYELLGLLGMFFAPPAIAMVRFILTIRRAEADAVLPEQPGLPGLETLTSDAVDMS